MFLKLSLRKIVQILSLILFLLFIYTTRLDSNLKLSLDFWLSLDPLAGLILPIASKELIGTLGPVIIIYLVTLLAGRFFCGWICPLGTTLDGLGTMARYKKKPSPTVAKKPRFFKYALLTALIFLAVLGLNLAFLASPLPLASRLYALIFYPLLEIGLEHLPINYLESWPYLELEPHLFNSAWITGLLWVAFFILERLRPRFWCRYLCPAGALLGVLAKFAPFRLQVLATSCTSCSQCAKNCPLGTDPRKNYSECIVCLKCQKTCQNKAISLGKSLKKEDPPLLASRRVFCESLVLAATLGGLNQLKSYTQEPSFLRPPGSLPEKDFLKLCLRCDLCLRACPTGALQPLGLTYGLSPLFTPSLEPRVGPCRPECTNCGEVCPTKAILKLPLKEKRSAKIGTAFINKETCLAWASDKRCMVCMENCPYGAILVETHQGKIAPVPQVLKERCYGCGYCEKYCPKEPQAIKVKPYQALRLKKPEFVLQAKALGLKFERDEANPKIMLKSTDTPPGFLD